MERIALRLSPRSGTVVTRCTKIDFIENWVRIPFPQRSIKHDKSTDRGNDLKCLHHRNHQTGEHYSFVWNHSGSGTLSGTQYLSTDFDSLP